MRVCLLPLLFAALVCRAEDVSAGVKAAFLKRDASLESFGVADSKSLNDQTTLILATAGPAQKDSTTFGVFLVFSPANRLRVIDIASLEDSGGKPVFDGVDAHSAHVQFLSEYGIYGGSIRYSFDLLNETSAVKTRYGFLAMNASAQKNGDLVYSASYGQWGNKQLDTRNARLTIHPTDDSAAPSWRLANLPAPTVAPTPGSAKAPRFSSPSVKPASFSIGGRQTLEVINQTPPGRERQPSFIQIGGGRGPKQTFPAPVPKREQRQYPPHNTPPTMENDIGPFAFDGRTLWFTNTFYDGEGISGVGAIGAFDSVTHRYAMRYLPEIKQWSGSAILLDGDDVWVGLMHRPEGANFGGGLLRYNKNTRAVRVYPLGRDVINTIDKIGDKIYCGTTNGLYMVTGDRVTHLRFEPDDTGKLTMVPQTVR